MTVHQQHQVLSMLLAAVVHCQSWRTWSHFCSSAQSHSCLVTLILQESHSSRLDRAGVHHEGWLLGVLRSIRVGPNGNMSDRLLGHSFVQESHSSRLEKRKKEAAAKEAMEQEMAAANKEKETAAAAAAAAEAEKRAQQRQQYATPGGAQRRATTPRRPLGL